MMGGDVPAHPEDVREGLTETKRRRAAAERDRAEAMADTREWLAAGHEAGLTVTELAALAGLTRRTVYTVLDGRNARRHVNRHKEEMTQ